MKKLLAILWAFIKSIFGIKSKEEDVIEPIKPVETKKSYLNEKGKYIVKKHKRSEQFIAESKALAEAKRQRRCERNLRLIQR